MGYGIAYELAFGVPEVDTDIGVDWGSGPIALGLVIISTVIIAPIAEELMFRGYVLDSIRKMHGDRVAIVISSMIFHDFNVFSVVYYFPHIFKMLNL